MDDLLQFAKDSQYYALVNGRKLNAILNKLDPSVEAVGIGRTHKAAGVLPYYPDGSVILGWMDANEGKDSSVNGANGEYEILGGKVIGEEYPAQTAAREFSEECRGFIDQKDILELLTGEIQVSHYFPKSGYTLFLVDARRLFGPKFKSADLSHVKCPKNKGRVACKIEIIEWAKDVQYRSFTKEVLFSRVVGNYLSRLYQYSKQTEDERTTNSTMD